MMLSLISKRSEHLRQLENLFRSEANMFILKNLIIEAKQSNLILNCESSEAKQTCSIVKQLISKLSEHVYINKVRYRSKGNTFDSSKIYFKAKRICL